MQQLVVLGLVDRAMKLPQSHKFDYFVRSCGREIYVEIKCFNERHDAYPETMLLSFEKYQVAREMIRDGHDCRVVVQYLDACIAYRFTTIPLPSVPAATFRPDRPNGTTVMMPKIGGQLLWLGTVAQHQPRIGVPL